MIPGRAGVLVLKRVVTLHDLDFLLHVFNHDLNLLEFFLLLAELLRVFVAVLAAITTIHMALEFVVKTGLFLWLRNRDYRLFRRYFIQSRDQGGALVCKGIRLAQLFIVESFLHLVLAQMTLFRR
mgnify:CR=1 FL=1